MFPRYKLPDCLLSYPLGMSMMLFSVAPPYTLTE